MPVDPLPDELALVPNEIELLFEPRELEPIAIAFSPTLIDSGPRAMALPAEEIAEFPIAIEPLFEALLLTPIAVE